MISVLTKDVSAIKTLGLLHLNLPFVPLKCHALVYPI